MDEYDIPKPVAPRSDPTPTAYLPPYNPNYPSPYPVGSQPEYSPPYPQGYQGAYQASYPPAYGPAAGHVSPPLTPPVGGRSSRPAGPAARGRGMIAAFLTTIGCLAGSLAVLAFVLSTIVINPDRPGQIVKAALSTSAGRSIATSAIANALRTANPTMSPAQASADAAAIVGSPLLTSSLGTSKSDVSTALLNQLRTVDPAAATAIAAKTTNANPLSALPTGLVTTANRAHTFLRSAEIVLLVIAVLAVLVALLIGPRRDRVLIRVGYWALGASVVQLIVWLGLPKLLGHFTDAAAQIGAAALRAGGAGLVGVFVALGVLGAVCLIIGYVVRATHLAAQ